VNEQTHNNQSNNLIQEKKNAKTKEKIKKYVNIVVGRNHTAQNHYLINY